HRPRSRIEQGAMRWIDSWLLLFLGVDGANGPASFSNSVHDGSSVVHRTGTVRMQTDAFHLDRLFYTVRGPEDTPEHPADLVGTPCRIAALIVRVDDDMALVGVLQVAEPLGDDPVAAFTLPFGTRARFEKEAQSRIHLSDGITDRVGNSIVLDQHPVETAVRFHMAQRHSVLVCQPTQGSCLVDDCLSCFQW